MTEPVDLAERLGRTHEHWSPKVIARLNDHEVKLVKVQGEFVWHTHDDTARCSSSRPVSSTPVKLAGR